MNVLEAIYSRRSVRKYTAVEVSKQNVEVMLRAAMSAPSAGNQQPWQFIVVDDKDLIDKIPTVHPYAHMCRDAYLVIIPCIDLKKEKHESFAVQDLAAATQNILLAARALGLGAVWLGTYPREERVEGVQQLFNLPEHILPFSVLPIGHTKVLQERINRYDADKVHHNTW
ncbi:MAG: nitroreductase family protein [Gammaproteobacteria bacterium]|nr:nitroreductase family protein [Gammaproteobacteria bacterium]